ncbi:SLAIN motif-containing protein 1-like [Cololabis saira]|uniref:SLAIN motif-containing protein 1-like n=1 Tax=Cololabis saira TaxID=129043 RepID=UPI002AD35F50|nr:SLAIN motif-containing protein 1-like [Cololabis saira]
MEAAVLSPAVLPELDCNSNSLSAELEVKKLQELVRRLERQNQQLRSRAGAPPSPGCGLRGAAGRRLTGPMTGPMTSPMPGLFCPPSLRSFSPTDEHFDYFHPHSPGDGAASAGEEDEDEEDGSEPSVLDDLELLDLEYLSCTDDSDETWLYETPRSRETSSEAVPPLQWCRQVLDSPRSEVDAARRNLSLRVEQVSRWRSSLSSPSPSSSPGPPISRVSGPSPLSASSPSAKHFSTPQGPERYAPSLSSPLHPVLHRTLSPIGKDLSPGAERTPMFLPHPAIRSSILRRSAFSSQSSLDSDLEDDSINLGYKLQDLTDVQVMARLQEESLRQDYASTSSVLASRRSQSFNLQLSQLGAGPGLEEEDEEDDEDYGLLPPPQPRLARLPHSHTFSSIRDWRRSTSSLCTPPSTPSTSPYPSAGFAFQGQPPLQPLGLGLGLGSLCVAEQQAFRPGSDKLRRSMPNLVRAPSMTSVPIPTNPSASTALLRNSQSFDSSSSLARLNSSIPSPGQLQNRVQSVGNFSSLSRPPLKATAYVSPTIKGSGGSSLQSLSGSSSSIPLLSKSPVSTPSTPRSSLPRPASFVATTSPGPRSKVAQPARSLLTPPKSLSTLSALRDCAWRDGCY